MPSIKELFPSRWLGASDLQGQEYTLVIRRVTIEELKQGSKTDATAKPVVWFADVPKGMVLNKTNAVVIARLYGDDTDTWAGKPVTLYPARERAFGQDWDVIRVRPSRPAMPASAPRTEHEPSHQPVSRKELTARWNALIDKADTLGIEIKAGARAVNSKWTDEQLGEYVATLAAKIEAAEVAAAEEREEVLL